LRVREVLIPLKDHITSIGLHLLKRHHVDTHWGPSLQVMSPWGTSHTHTVAGVWESCCCKCGTCLPLASCARWGCCSFCTQCCSISYGTSDWVSVCHLSSCSVMLPSMFCVSGWQTSRAREISQITRWT
jgi:hypothetical protein